MQDRALKIENSQWYSCIIAMLILVLSSCATVKPYQQVYLKDGDMELAPKDLEQFEIDFQTYREGAAGGGGSTGAGCGCN